jgi:hypothetical protein
MSIHHNTRHTINHAIHGPRHRIRRPQRNQYRNPLVLFIGDGGTLPDGSCCGLGYDFGRPGFVGLAQDRMDGLEE